jgi:hypothetical protein
LLGTTTAKEGYGGEMEVNAIATMVAVSPVGVVKQDHHLRPSFKAIKSTTGKED